MKARITRPALVGVALLCLFAPTSFAAAAGPAPGATAFSLPAVTLDVPASSELAVLVPEVAVTYRPTSGVVYRPKGTGTPPADYHHPNKNRITNVTQIYGGRLDPDGVTDGEFLFGIRTGPKVSPHVQFGVLFDWVRDSEYNATYTSAAPGPGGIDVTTQHDYSGAYSDLFPLMGFIQLSLNEKRFFSPYVGAAGGYEWMNVSAYDRYGYWYDATYGGWGWQGWAGVGLHVANGVRVTGEALYNAGELTRDVYDPVNGWTNREIVPVYGVGARFGLAFGF